MEARRVANERRIEVPKCTPSHLASSPLPFTFCPSVFTTSNLKGSFAFGAGESVPFHPCLRTENGRNGGCCRRPKAVSVEQRLQQNRFRFRKSG
ncbi:hypothetical protein JTE90_026547 [Oedothorax gibbosus]|uniref:Uncharacterized protein n=1 Tax=Oedothorax gibbosus TaxID=931172 RepID=A0AAV6U7M1_9ARAC|nr:hypothetical protein JTE90_026547 [Oedothorax gibbosus]